MMEDQYDKGAKNGSIRAYFYLGRGLNELNNWKNLFLGIIGLAIALKFDSVGLMIVMFLVSIPILALVGYVMVHHVSRLTEYLGVKFGSHYAMRNFDYVKAQYELLEDIKRLLEDAGK